MKKIILLLATVLAFTIANAQVEPSSNVQDKIKINAPVKTSMKIEDLKKAITKHLSKYYSGFKPVEAYQIETKGVTSYEVIVENTNNKLNSYYDNDGNYIRKEVGKKTPVSNTVPKTNNTNKSDTTKQDTLKKK